MYDRVNQGVGDIMLKYLKINKLATYTFIGFVLFSLTACSIFTTSNNHLKIEDLVEHLVSKGVEVQQVQALEPKVVGASRAFAVTIAGKEVGIYKFDINLKKHEEKLARIKAEGYVFVLGLKFPAVVEGSFLLIGVNDNPEKNKILNALESFK
jgi:hypothetical protein